MMKNLGFKPNVMTYGILAMGCGTVEKCNELLEQMHMRKYRLNIEILGAMLAHACYLNDFKYVIYLMELCLSEDVHPNKIFMEKLEIFKKKWKRKSNEEVRLKYK